MFGPDTRPSMAASRDGSVMSKGNMNNSMLSGGSARSCMYESVTIKKQYDDYTVIKEETLKKAQKVVKISYIFILIFALYLLLTVILIFTDQTVPALSKISMAIGGSSDTTH